MKKILFLAFVGFLACKKSVEIVEVPTEKQTSWMEVPGFSGIGRIFLGSGRSDAALYFQQPYFFTEYKNSKITQYGAGLPTDIDIRLPISSQFTATAYSDTILRVFSNTNPITSPTGGYFNLKQIDPAARAIQTRAVPFRAMAINENGVLALVYTTDQPQFNLLLMKVTTSANYPYVDTIFTRKVRIARTSVGAYIRQVETVGDYFLVGIPAQGLYKIREDGTVTKVEFLKAIDAFYAWQGKVYGHAEWGTAYISDNNADSWQPFEGIPAFMTSSQFYTVKDSLIGASRDNIYTLKWENNRFTTRFLKNDGLENVQINGVEVLKDSVYVATTAGLFVKPVAVFFEGK